MRDTKPTRGVFRGPRTLSIMPTYTCPASCADCGTLSGPHERSNIDLGTMLSAIKQAHQAGFCNVVFTGGEATLRWSDLKRAIAFATKLGMPTRIVSNAHWALTMDRARVKLQELIESGLSEINYSTGDEHAKYIPVERVAYATVAAIEQDLPVHVVVELRRERAVSRETLLAVPEMAALSPVQLAKVSILEGAWMPLDPFKYQEYPVGLTVDRQNLAAKPGCDNLLQTYTVQADGRVGACCGQGLRKIPELNVATTDSPGFLGRAIEEAEGDFMKLWIHYRGPERILAWAAEKDPRIKWEGMYAHHCQACQRIYSDPLVIDVIRRNYKEVIAEVTQTVWLDERMIPSVAPARGPTRRLPRATNRAVNRRVGVRGLNKLRSSPQG